MISQTGDQIACPTFLIDPAAAARFFHAPPSAATAGFPHDSRPAALPEPSSREIPPAWYIAGNPAARPLRTTRTPPNRYFPARLLSSAQPHLLPSPRPARRRSARNRR